MRRVFLSALTAALVFTIGCGGGSDTGEMSNAAAEEGSPAGTPTSPGPVPLTITMPALADQSSVKKVQFPDYPPADWYERKADETQYKVGDVAPNSDDLFEFKVNYSHSNAPNDPPDAATTNQTAEFSFASESLCEGGATEGKIDRIACAVVGKGGERLVCTATYDKMSAPPDTCVGTQACVLCPDKSRACGSNPQCSAN